MSEQPRDGGSEKGDCPACDHPVSKVIDSRGTLRRRECVACGTRWLTEEIFAYVIEKRTTTRAGIPI